MAAKLTILPALAAAVLAVAAAPALAVPNTPLPAPTPSRRPPGRPFNAVPSPSRGPRSPTADHYEFQLAADAGWDSPVLGQRRGRLHDPEHARDHPEDDPERDLLLACAGGRSGGYGLRLDRQAAPSSKSWTTAAALQSPAGGAGLSFGTDPLKLGWSAVPGAANYLVSLATDPSLGSLAFHLDDDPTGIPKVQANSLAVSIALATGTYYWNVIPLDAEGNRGAASATASFSWTWPSTTTLQVTDLNSAPEVYDPQFSWAPVAGAARYEVEINSSSDFAAGSKVCCLDDDRDLARSDDRFKDNTYYWRVRAIDPSGSGPVGVSCAVAT